MLVHFALANRLINKIGIVQWFLLRTLFSRVCFSMHCKIVILREYLSTKITFKKRRVFADTAVVVVVVVVVVVYVHVFAAVFMVCVQHAFM